MNPSHAPGAGPTQTELAAQLSGELIRLRDALVTLSIHLTDWQFECDQSGQRNAQAIVDATLQRFSLPPRAGTGSDERSSLPPLKTS